MLTCALRARVRVSVRVRVRVKVTVRLVNIDFADVRSPLT